MSAIKSINGINRLQIKSFNGILKSSVSNKNGITNQRPRSLPFDGVNDYVNLSTHIASLDFNAPATISAWVKLNGSHKTTGGILFSLSVNATGVANVIGIGDASSSWTNEVLYIRSSVSGINGVAFVDANDNYSNVWMHVVAICSGSAWTLYLNGVSKTLTTVGSNTGKWGDAFSPDKASIGTILRAAGNASPFPGWIDQFSIWNKALSAAEVSEIYALKPSSVPDYSTLSFWANRVIWLPIGESPDVWGTTNGIKDSSGNGLNGTMTNFDPAGSFSTDVAT